MRVACHNFGSWGLFWVVEWRALVAPSIVCSSTPFHASESEAGCAREGCSGGVAGGSAESAEGQMEEEEASTQGLTI